ncbi:CAP domain-containing protein [Endothiovibrio diazotrophicus]
MAATDSAVYDYLNAQRAAAGMSPLAINALLEQAATNHAEYLSINRTTGHWEDSANRGYTGDYANGRVAAVGYSSQQVSENLVTGLADDTAAVDNLMGAIYHRLGFLDFTIDEVGIGSLHPALAVLDPQYVYDMGNAGVRALCEGAAFAGSGAVGGVCAPDRPVDGAALRRALDGVANANPSWVLWPPDGALRVPPAFYDEVPDPLPDYAVSGYPISIQFNDRRMSEVQLTSFRLYRVGDGQEVTDVRLLDRSNDPAGDLSAYQFALFPLERLAWDTEYRVEARFVADGVVRGLSWQFKTRNPGYPLYAVAGQGETISVGAGSTLAVYIPPSAEVPYMSQVRWSASGDVAVESRFADNNTLIVSVTGAAGGSVLFTTDAGGFSVVTTAEAPLTALDEEPDYASPAAASPAAASAGVEPSADCGELPRYELAGERLTIPAVAVGVDYFNAELPLLSAEGLRFAVSDVQPAIGASGCAGAVYDPLSGAVTLPRVELVPSSAGYPAYRVVLWPAPRDGELGFSVGALRPL